MSDLDYFSLSRLLGGTMQPITKPVFGPFGLLPIAVETAKGRLRPNTAKPRFTLPQEKLIARSFEQSRDGAPPDALLWDMELRNRFLETCQKNGLDFPSAGIVRRLLAIRKNPQKYARLGIFIKPTLRTESYPSLLVEYAPVIEFSLVRLRYRHGASIDEILIDPALGQEFEAAALAVMPNLTSQSMRQAALTLRKTRFLRKSSRAELKKLKLRRLEPAWTPFQALASLDLTAVPSTPGIIEIREPERELYISRNANVQGVLKLLAKKDAVSIMANPFWMPNLEIIQARFLPEPRLDVADLDRWELKLLSERSPIFNWPLTKPKRAA